MPLTRKSEQAQVRPCHFALALVEEIGNVEVKKDGHKQKNEAHGFRRSMDILASVKDTRGVNVDEVEKFRCVLDEQEAEGQVVIALAHF